MHDLAPLITDLTLMLGVAAIVVLIFQRIKQPVVLGYLVAGMLLGPYLTTYQLVSDVPNVKILSELGVIFLMFSLGLEFSFHKLTRVGFSALITGVFDVTMMVALGYSAGLILGWGQTSCLFLGAAVAISSTTIIFKAMQELGLKTKRFAEVIFGVLIVEDLLAILLLVALSTIVVTKNIFSPDMFFATLKLILVVGAWFLAGYFIVPPLFRRLSSYVNQETLTIVAIALCLFLVSVAAYFHYSTALGAFIMGSILAETVLVKRVEELIVPIRDIFGAIFFISVGMLINPSVIIQEWPVILFIALVLVLGKVLVISIGTFLTGQSMQTAVRAGFGMAQIGEFSFIIATLGLSLNAINDKFYPIIVAVSGITTFTTPYMIRFSGHVSQFLERRFPERIKYFLDSYTAWVYRVQTSSKSKSPWGSITLRLIANGITVAIIFILVSKLAYPYLLNWGQEKAKLFSEIIAIILASPFIWGMLFSYRKNILPEYTQSTLNPAMFVIWLVTLVEIVFLSVVFFHTWVTMAVLAIVVITFFVVSYRQLEKSYHWFENRLIQNINQKTTKQVKYSELAPWDTHFVEMTVGNRSAFVNRSLRKCQIRQDYGVNVVAIHRGQNTILAPRGDEIIRDNDKLIVLGNDEQIDLFKNEVVRKSSSQEALSRFDDFILIPVQITQDHPLVGQSIRDSQIREKVKGLVVGIERDNERILNPDPEMVLAPGDLLFIVSEVAISPEY